MRQNNGDTMARKKLADRFRPTSLRAVQTRVVRRLIILVGTLLFRLKLDVDGLENVPRGEPLIVAAAPHRSWIDTFLLAWALPPLPRVYFLGSAEQTQNKLWRRLVLFLAGGFVPVSTVGQFNRESLTMAQAILEAGNGIGIYPEGWENVDASAREVEPLKRGVAFISEHSGRRILPVGLAGNSEFWRGKTLRLRIAPPIAALPAGSDRKTEQTYLDRLRETLQATLPPEPPEPPDGKKPWRWMTDML
jgi:1-acyl-sn-glycerol-3-phosphate acyltransferase